MLKLLKDVDEEIEVSKRVENYYKSPHINKKADWGSLYVYFFKE